MNSSTSIVELAKIKSILDKLELIAKNGVNEGSELSDEDHTFLDQPSNNEQFQAMKNIIKDEIIPIITANKLRGLQNVPIESRQLKEIISKIEKIKRQYDEIRMQNQNGGKRKRTQSKKSKKNKKRKSYKKRQT